MKWFLAIYKVRGDVCDTDDLCVWGYCHRGLWVCWANAFPNVKINRSGETHVLALWVGPIEVQIPLAELLDFSSVTSFNFFPWVFVVSVQTVEPLELLKTHGLHFLENAPLDVPIAGRLAEGALVGPKLATFLCVIHGIRKYLVDKRADFNFLRGSWLELNRIVLFKERPELLQERIRFAFLFVPAAVEKYYNCVGDPVRLCRVVVMEL